MVAIQQESLPSLPNSPNQQNIYCLKYKYVALISWGFPFLAVLISTSVTYANNWNDFVNFTSYCTEVQTHFKVCRVFATSLQFLHPIEALSLVLMSVMHVTSIFAIHAFAFTTWGVCFILYIMFDTYLHHVSGWRSASKKTQITFWIKVMVLISLFTCGAALMCFFIRWRRFCQELVYSLFCITEYMIIILNLIYHLLVCIEIPNCALVVTADFSSLYPSEGISSDTCSTTSTDVSAPSSDKDEEQTSSPITHRIPSTKHLEDTFSKIIEP